MSSRSRRYRPLDVEPSGEQHLSLPVERQMPSIFGNENGGDHRFGRQPAFDQPFQRRRLQPMLPGRRGRHIWDDA
jgi:hypothetical protein